MSEMKCPFCQQELEDANIHSSGLYFECPNCYDKQKEKDDNYTATPKVWQELIRTRKALEIAVDALKTVRRYTAINQFAPKSREAHIVAKKAVAEITALEQKDK
jgi:hypothetical protein